jgi:hypothetical protein
MKTFGREKEHFLQNYSTNGKKLKTTTNIQFGNLFHRTTPFWPSVSQLYFKLSKLLPLSFYIKIIPFTEFIFKTILILPISQT